VSDAQEKWTNIKLQYIPILIYLRFSTAWFISTGFLF